MSLPRLLAAILMSLVAMGLSSCATVSAPTATLAPIAAVRVVLSEPVRQLSAADPRFNADAIAGALETALSARRLYAPAPEAQRTLLITVTGFTNELASDTSLFGFSFRNVGMMAQVQVKEGATSSVPFDVHARVRLSHRGDAASDAGSLDTLFARFAAQTVADLEGQGTGAPGPR
jgi:hypothetical protein